MAEAGPVGLRQIDYEGIDPAVVHESRDVGVLKGILLNPRERMWERYRALFALRAVGTPEAIALIGRCMLSDGSALLRHECAFVFGQMAQADCIPWLERSLRGDEHPMVRHEAAEALGAIANDECLAMLRWAMVNDPAIEVRESCEVALDNIAYLRDPSRF
jgi:deoxyhypusine monooxygenase